jgi:protein-tyrosine phosphatase
MESACANNENLFVHCQMGKSRSVSFIIAYLMKYEKMKLDAAYLYVKKLRRIAFPNIGFMRQLKEYEKHLFCD